MVKGIVLFVWLAVMAGVFVNRAIEDEPEGCVEARTCIP